MDDSKEQQSLNALQNALDTLRANKPQDRSEEARHWAIAITEMEKTIAYFAAYVAPGFLK